MLSIGMFSKLAKDVLGICFVSEVYTGTTGNKCVVCGWFCTTVADDGWDRDPKACIYYLAHYIKRFLTKRVTSILHLWTLTHTLGVLNSCHSQNECNYIDSTMISSKVLKDPWWDSLWFGWFCLLILRAYLIMYFRMVSNVL